MPVAITGHDAAPAVTVAIRTRNEIRTIATVLRLLKSQTYPIHELLVIDNLSTDGTREIAAREADRVIDVAAFTHAGSTNLAIDEARGELVYLTNGHCFPDHAELLEAGARTLAADARIAGVYGRCRPHRDALLANTFERAIAFAGNLTWPRTFQVERRFRPGMMQTQSAMVRRSLARSVPFEDIGAGGGEDALFAMEVLHRGHLVAYHPALDVQHSHGGWNSVAAQRFLAYGRMIARAREIAASRGIPASIRGRR